MDSFNYLAGTCQAWDREFETLMQKMAHCLEALPLGANLAEIQNEHLRQIYS